MKKTKIDEALDRCIELLRDGASVQYCMAKYPQFGQDLRGQLEAACALLELRPRTEPSPDGQSRGRARLLAAIPEARSGASLFAGARWAGLTLLPRAAPAVLVALVLGGGAWSAASATTDVPGPATPVVHFFSADDGGGSDRGNGNGNGDNSGPGGGDATPDDDHSGPGGGDGTPDDDHSGPGGGDATPNDANSGPGGGDATPDDDNSGPGGGSATPDDGNSGPGGADATPDDGS